MIDLLTVDFNAVNRNELRRLARANGISGITFGGRLRPPHASLKDELVRGFEQARADGRFGAVTPKANVTVKTSTVFVFLKGKECSGRHETHIAGQINDGVLRIFGEYGPDDMNGTEPSEDFERFHTTLDDLKAFVAALEANAP